MKSSDLIISAAVEKAVRVSTVLKFANVTAVNGQKVTVDLDGTHVPNVPCIKSYTPTVGDRAWLLHQGSMLVAIGSN